jgi:hypothetical protein
VYWANYTFLWNCIQKNTLHCVHICCIFNINVPICVSDVPLQNTCAICINRKGNKVYGKTGTVPWQVEHVYLRIPSWTLEAARCRGGHSAWPYRTVWTCHGSQWREANRGSEAAQHIASSLMWQHSAVRCFLSVTQQPNTHQQRKYDRATSFMLRPHVQEVFVTVFWHGYNFCFSPVKQVTFHPIKLTMLLEPTR